MTLRNLPTEEWPFEICELWIVCIKLRDVTQPLPPQSIAGRHSPVSLPGKSPADDGFHDQMVGGPGGANADAEIDFPLGRDVNVNRGYKLLLLFVQRIEVTDRPESAVVFQAAAYYFAVACPVRPEKIVADSEIRRELYSPPRILSMQRRVERGIERPIPASQFLIHDGPYLPGPRVRRKFSPLIADLVGKAHAHRPVPRFRRAHPRTNVISHPLPAVAVMDAGKNVEAGFKPVGESLCDLDGLVHRAIGRLQTIYHFLFTLDGVIAVQLDHGAARMNGFAGINLYLVIILRPAGVSYACQPQE